MKGVIIVSLVYLAMFVGCTSRGILLYQGQIGDYCVSTTIGGLRGSALAGITVDKMVEGICYNGKRDVQGGSPMDNDNRGVPMAYFR